MTPGMTGRLFSLFLGERGHRHFAMVYSANLAAIVQRYLR
jgi:hypothetical protein